jgi:hypothetical protein
LTNAAKFEIIYIETVEKGLNRMTTNFPVFPAPSAAVVAEARNYRCLRAAHAWMKESRVALHDGREVVPTLRVAYDAAKAIAKGMPSVGIVVAEGAYELASSFDAREAADKLKSERFAQFMAEDKPAATSTGVCDTCGLIGAPVNNHYAPDGMSYPTLVFQQCTDGCAEVN